MYFFFKKKAPSHAETEAWFLKIQHTILEACDKPINDFTLSKIFGSFSSANIKSCCTTKNHELVLLSEEGLSTTTKFTSSTILFYFNLFFFLLLTTIILKPKKKKIIR